MRIIRVLSDGKGRTVQEIGTKLADVPTATLYRHIKKLLEGEFLEVVEERQVGGAVERVFALRDQAGFLSAEDIAHATKEDHMRYFTLFCAMLMSDFNDYLQRETIDFVADGVGYRTVSLYLDDHEFLELVARLQECIAAYKDNRPAPGRRRRLLSTVVMPAES